MAKANLDDACDSTVKALGGAAASGRKGSKPTAWTAPLQEVLRGFEASLEGLSHRFGLAGTG